MAIQRVRSATTSPTTRASNWTWPSSEEPGPLWQMGTTLQVGCRLCHNFTVPLSHGFQISLHTMRHSDT